MKADIHPKYVDATIICACGEVIHTRSTKPEIRVGVCSKCHPFFTGTQKYVDTAGRVEKFMKKYAAERRPKKVRRRAAAQVPDQQTEKTDAKLSVETPQAVESHVAEQEPSSAPGEPAQPGEATVQPQPSEGSEG